ncbi:hypothetical protein E0K89_016205 [Aquicoccus sp. SCR17]|nr:hypothetical protein [Carideicomes alvinocaridis]
MTMSETATAPREDERIEEAIIRSARSNHQKLPVLEVILDRFALALGPAMKSHCAGAAAEAELESFSYLTAGEALDSLPPHGLAAIAEAREWKGDVALVVDPDLLFATLEIMLGGRSATRAAWVPRSYSAIERRFGARLCEMVLAELSGAFASLCAVAFDIDRIEGSPQALVLAPPASPCIKVVMRVTLEERSGTLTFLFPHAALDSVRPILSQPFRGGALGGDSSWRAQISDRLQETGVTLEAVLCEPRLSLTDVLGWQPGQILDLGIEPDEDVVVSCSGLAMFSAAIGRRRNGSVALRVTRDFSETPDQTEEVQDGIPD